MATTTVNTTNYAGEFAGQYIGSALLEQVSLQNGIFTVKPNIKYKQTVKRATISGQLVADASCDFTSTATITLDDRVLEPKELQINVEQCKLDFANDWDALSMGIGAFDQLPRKYEDYIIARMLEKHMAQTESNLYTGDASNSGEFNGFATLIALDANLPAAQEVTGTTVAAANVIDELASILDATPTRVRQQPDFYIAVAPNIYYAYVRALGGFASGGVGANGVDNKGTTWWNGGTGNILFEGVPLKLANGLDSNVAFATYTANLWFGTGLLSDHNEVSLIDMGPTLGSKNVRFVARYTSGVQYGFAGDVVTYGIVNSAN